MEQHIIFGNYGNETMGMLQFARAQGLSNVCMVSVDTGWQAAGWDERVKAGEAYAKAQGFDVVRLNSKLSFARLIEDRGNFPSPQFQWCAGFLKALPFIDWLDEVDPGCEALLMLGNRRALAKGQATLQEYIQASEHFGERRIWHPLYDCSNDKLMQLVANSGLEWLQHRSLECDPCVNNSPQDFIALQERDIKKTAALEKNMQKPMFSPESYGDAKGIEQVIRWVKKHKKSATLSSLDMGCGSPFGCGL